MRKFHRSMRLQTIKKQIRDLSVIYWISDFVLLLAFYWHFYSFHDHSYFLVRLHKNVLLSKILIDQYFFSSPMLSSHIVSTVGILGCTEMRGFTLEWDEFSIRLSRLGQQVMLQSSESFDFVELISHHSCF